MNEPEPTDDFDRHRELRVHDAGPENPQYYIERREEVPDVHYCCFGGTTFVKFADESGPRGGAPLGTHHLWQRERDGARIDAAGRSETVWGDGGPD